VVGVVEALAAAEQRSDGEEEERSDPSLGHCVLHCLHQAIHPPRRRDLPRRPAWPTFPLVESSRSYGRGRRARSIAVLFLGVFWLAAFGTAEAQLGGGRTELEQTLTLIEVD